MESKKNNGMTVDEQIKMIDDTLIRLGLRPSVPGHKKGSFVFIPPRKKPMEKELSDESDRKDD